MDPGQRAYEIWCRHARAYLPWDELEPSERDAWRSSAQTLAEEEVKAGRRKPDNPQLQMTGEGWRIWGGNVEEPIAMTVAEVYTSMLNNRDPKEAQKVLDMTREGCGEHRLAIKKARGKQKEEVEALWSRLREELDAAIKIKLDRGISTIK